MRTDFSITENDRYRLLAEYSTDIISTLSPEGIYTFISPAVRTILGYEPEELLGTSGYDLIHPDDVKVIAEKHIKAFTEKSSSIFTYRIRNKEHKYLWMETTSQPIMDDETFEIIEFIVVSRDITERMKMQQERNKLLEELELRVEERTKLLSLANEALAEEMNKSEEATKQMAQKNKEMTDSIQYARRIQKAVLPKVENFYSMFSESFVFSKARDIVSGDFLWMHDKGDKQIIALIDCSGHGVPGAFMSIIGNDLLEKIIADESENRPSVILQKLEDRLIVALRNGGSAEDVKDGMDIGICVIDKTKNKISFSGAYRSLFFRDKTGVLQEVPGNPFSIGGGVNGRRKDFKLETFSFEPGTIFYMSSDGYYSQFGGENGKKFMKSRFRETLAQISRQPVEQQKELLAKTFDEWKGANEQVDDVLVVGFRV